MMGVEREALDEVMDALVKNGMKLELALRKARSFVSWVKSRCIVTLHTLPAIKRLQTAVTLGERY
ncbi:hypothetical protein D3C80_1858280 [compost metagenome]